MVLPVPNTGGKKNKGKKPKKGGGKGMGGGDGDVQVNLIVDPNVFSGGRDDEDSDDEASDGDNGLPGGYYGVGGGAKGRAKARRNKRRSVFAGLAMEAEWKIARAWAKKIAFVDAVGVVVWGAVFVIVLIGKRCPSGGFDGWYVPCLSVLTLAFPDTYILSVHSGVTLTMYLLRVLVCCVLLSESVYFLMSRICMRVRHLHGHGHRRSFLAVPSVCFMFTIGPVLILTCILTTLVTLRHISLRISDLCVFFQGDINDHEDNVD